MNILSPLVSKCCETRGVFWLNVPNNTLAGQNGAKQGGGIVAKRGKSHCFLLKGSQSVAKQGGVLLLRGGIVATKIPQNTVFLTFFFRLRRAQNRQFSTIFYRLNAVIHDFRDEVFCVSVYSVLFKHSRE